MRVDTVVSTGSLYATLLTGNAPIDGTEYVRIGNTTDDSRQGSLYLTADDNGAPFIDVIDEVSS